MWFAFYRVIFTGIYFIAPVIQCRGQNKHAVVCENRTVKTVNSKHCVNNKNPYNIHRLFLITATTVGKMDTKKKSPFSRWSFLNIELN
jgi:hypothetical protein